MFWPSFQCCLWPRGQYFTKQTRHPLEALLLAFAKQVTSDMFNNNTIKSQHSNIYQYSNICLWCKKNSGQCKVKFCCYELTIWMWSNCKWIKLTNGKTVIDIGTQSTGKFQSELWVRRPTLTDNKWIVRRSICHLMAVSRHRKLQQLVRTTVQSNTPLFLQYCSYWTSANQHPTTYNRWASV